MIQKSFIIMVLASCFIGAANAQTDAASKSFPCSVVISKSQCWKDYNITVDVSDAITLKQKDSYSLPKGTNLLKKTFTCSPLEQLTFSTSFTPIIWEQGKGKSYQASQIYQVPAAIEKGRTQWLLQLCYPSDFQGLPIPPAQQEGDCACVFPKVKTK